MDEKTTKNISRDYYFFALKIAGNFGATIAVPVVVFSLIGRNLDARFNSSPIYTIAGFVLAALLSGLIIFRKAKKFGTEFQSLVNKNPK